MKVVRIALVCLFFAAVGGRAASAEQVLFNNLGPGDTYDLHRAAWFGFDFGQEDSPDSQGSSAVPFVPSVTATLSTLELPLEFPWSFDDGTFQLSLYESTAGPAGWPGRLPGTLLESWASAGPLLPSGLTTFTSSVEPLLLAGTTYFLAVSTIGRADGLWYLTLTDPAERIFAAGRQHDGPWLPFTRLTMPALRVSGEEAMAATPEPGAIILALTGLGYVVRRRRG